MKKALATLFSISLLLGSMHVAAQTTASKDSAAKAAKKAAKAQAKAEKAKAAAATTTAPTAAPKAAPTAAPTTPPPVTAKAKTPAQGVNKSADKVVGTDAKGRTIYQGPKGGQYTLTPAGNKEYIKKPS